MSVDETDKVDFIIREADGGVWLVVTDHRSWGDAEHLWTLQEKLNTYFAFIESGQIRDHVAEGADIGIRIVLRHEPDQQAQDFLMHAGEVSGRAGYPLTYEVRGDA